MNDNFRLYAKQELFNQLIEICLHNIDDETIKHILQSKYCETNYIHFLNLFQQLSIVLCARNTISPSPIDCYHCITNNYSIKTAMKQIGLKHLYNKYHKNMKKDYFECAVAFEDIMKIYNLFLQAYTKKLFTEEPLTIQFEPTGNEYAFDWTYKQTKNTRVTYLILNFY